MSWIDKLNNVAFTITTGDGKVFSPLWKNGEKSKEFNITKYDFINTAGSLIDRKQPQSNLYPLVFWFQGEDNIEQCDAFEDSANDNRAWTIQHPFYGTLKGQPVNLKRNDTSYNATEVTVDFWESIDGDFPDSEISITDETRAKATNVNALAASYLVENAAPETEDIDTVKENVSLMSSKFNADKDSFNDYINIVNKATLAADSLVTDTENAFIDIQQAVNAPAEFAGSVFSKIDSYVEAYQVLKESIGNLFSKYDFESQGASIISGICISCVNPEEDDYVTRTDIERANGLLIDLYDDYLSTLDANQVEIYDVENTWSPTIQIQSAIIDLVTFTSNSLFSLSFNARQERSYELKKDSNLILLTHRFIGLDASDKNIETFRKINNIKNDELYKVKEGRTIKYFV